MARLEPMASTSSSVGLVRGHKCCPARVASRWRGRTCPYRLRGACWFGHDDDLEGVPPCRDVAATSCRVDAATASDLVVRVRRLERIVEQIGGVLVPQILEGDVDVLQHIPQERVQNSAVELIGGVPAPQIWEPIVDGPHHVPRERVQNRTPEQIMGSPVPQIMEDGLPVVPLEREQNRTPEQIVGVPVPQIMEDGLPVVPQERVQHRTSEQIADSPVPQFMGADVEIMHAPPQERVLHRTPEPIVDVPVPHIKEDGLLIIPQKRAVYTSESVHCEAASSS